MTAPLAPVPEPTPAPEPTTPRTEIEYVVLSRGFEQQGWTSEGRPKAKNPDAAIEAVIGSKDPGDTEYVAIAARYWSPQTYAVEVETIRKLVPKASK